MKKTLIWSLTVLLVFAIALPVFGCATTAETTAAETTAVVTEAETSAAVTEAETTAAETKEDTGLKTIGMAMLSSSIQVMVSWMAELNKIDQDYNTRSIWKSCDTDINKQFTDIDNLLAMGVDGMIIDPTDFKAIAPAVQKVVDAKVPVVISNATVDVPGAVSAVIDEQRASEEMGEVIAASINYKGLVCLIQGQIGNFANDNRTTGFKKAMDKYPDIEVIMAPTDWNAVKAVEVTENWLATYPKIDAIWGLDDSIVVPILETLKTKNRTEMKVFGLGSGVEGSFPALENGQLWANSAYGIQRIAWWEARTLYEVMNGRTENSSFDVAVVMTKENYDLCLQNGLSKDIKVLDIEGAKAALADPKGEFGIATVDPKYK